MESGNDQHNNCRHKQLHVHSVTGTVCKCNHTKCYHRNPDQSSIYCDRALVPKCYCSITTINIEQRHQWNLESGNDQHRGDWDKYLHFYTCNRTMCNCKHDDQYIDNRLHYPNIQPGCCNLFRRCISGFTYHLT